MNEILSTYLAWTIGKRELTVTLEDANLDVWVGRVSFISACATEAAPYILFEIRHFSFLALRRSDWH